MSNTDTPRTDALPSTQIMLTAQSDPVELYQQLCACVEYKDQLAASKAEVEKLDAERRELSRQLHLHEMGMYHEPKMQKEIDKLQSQLAQAVEIAEMFSQVKGLHHQCNCAMCQKLAALKEEIK
jgi:hypothetical protein